LHSASREVERECGQLQRRIGGQLLRDWAERVIPAVPAPTVKDGRDHYRIKMAAHPMFTASSKMVDRSTAGGACVIA
jgi:hypothetical protein